MRKLRCFTEATLNTVVHRPIGVHPSSLHGREISHRWQCLLAIQIWEVGVQLRIQRLRSLDYLITPRIPGFR